MDAIQNTRPMDGSQWGMSGDFGHPAYDACRIAASGMFTGSFLTSFVENCTGISACPACSFVVTQQDSYRRYR